ncbi:MAG TPA: ABC transporter ATP-binding protein [Blastocatellia bacterium]|nr:ABC transporter ATP-binding protein [Blastocatellia bacterium]HMY73088.1 ABC transporter ATP-binding protein [Blastocatellia bacterium]
MTEMTIEHLSVSYGETQALRDFTLTIRAGELVALLGPSGCGKSTVLKVVAGLLAPGGGEVLFDGVSILPTPAERRGATMVFQKPLLFPHLTVAENVAFGLKMRRMNKAEIARRVAEALQWVRLEGYERRKPNELSGGQEQRVSLARALVTEPRVLLLDEPFSALDENLRGEMRQLVRELQQRLRITTIFVTHDQREAFAVADRVALLLDGRIEQAGAPRDLLLEPASAAAAKFFGWKLLPGEGQSVAAFRPESARLCVCDGTAGALTGKLEALLDLGVRRQWRVRLAGGELLEAEQLSAPCECLPRVGDDIQLVLPENALRRYSSN